MVIRAEYSAAVRHALLTLFLSVAVAAAGLVSANAAFACPIAAPAAAAAHDCCPDGAPVDQEDQGGGEQGMMNCPLMHLCRTAPALAPEAAPIGMAATAFIPLKQPRMDAVLSSTPDDGLFRPPRTL